MRPLLCAAIAISVACSSSALTQMEWPMLLQSPPAPGTMATWYKPCACVVRTRAALRAAASQQRQRLTRRRPVAHPCPLNCRHKALLDHGLRVPNLCT